MLSEDIENQYSDTELLSASRSGDVRIVKLLLEYSNKTPEKMIDINIQDKDGYTPLIFASCFRYPSIVKLLLKNPEKTNIDVNIKTIEGWTALMWASFRGYLNVIKLLLKHRKIKLYDLLRYNQIKEVLRRHSNNPSEFSRKPKKEVKYYDKRF